MNGCPKNCWAFKDLQNSGVVYPAKDINGKLLGRWGVDYGKDTALPNIIRYCPFCGSKLTAPEVDDADDNSNDK